MSIAYHLRFRLIRSIQRAICVMDDSPEYPSGLDPELREGINIVQDMLKLESSGK